MPQATWSGSISFGLIGVREKLCPATKWNDVRFHVVEHGTASRLPLSFLR